jgi:hypothetical protein
LGLLRNENLVALPFGANRANQEILSKRNQEILVALPFGAYRANQTQEEKRREGNGKIRKYYDKCYNKIYNILWLPLSVV